MSDCLTPFVLEKKKNYTQIPCKLVIPSRFISWKTLELYLAQERKILLCSHYYKQFLSLTSFVSNMKQNFVSFVLCQKTGMRLTWALIRYFKQSIITNHPKLYRNFNQMIKISLCLSLFSSWFITTVCKVWCLQNFVFLNYSSKTRRLPAY